MGTIEQMLANANALATQVEWDRTTALAKAEEDYVQGMAKVDHVILAIQEVCPHDSTSVVRWTEDGAYPNEPRSMVVCDLCKKEHV